MNSSPQMMMTLTLLLFHFHGFGHMGQGPPPSPEANVPPMPNLNHLAAMGWGVWPQPAEQPPKENIPVLIPLNANNDNPTPVQAAEAAVAEPVEEIIQALGF